MTLRDGALATLRDGASSTPAPVTRDGARSAAQHELSKHGYHQHDPSPTERAVRWLLNKLSDAFSTAARHSPGKGIGLFVVVVVIAVLIVVITTRLRRMQRLATAAQPILDADITTPADHRRRAEKYAEEQQWAQAVREWLRAITRELEERGTLDPRPGRTAAELCAEAGARLPAIAEELRRATKTFDAIWYGGRPANARDEQLLRSLDQRVAKSHHALIVASR